MRGSRPDGIADLVQLHPQTFDDELVFHKCSPVAFATIMGTSTERGYYNFLAPNTGILWSVAHISNAMRLPFSG
jgi:hypothetical protein